MPDRMSERMPEDMQENMPDRVPEDMPDKMPEDMSDRMPEDMPDRMSENMPDKMPEDMSDRMPEDLPVTKSIDVMVGITRSKVIFLYHLHHCWDPYGTLRGSSDRSPMVDPVGRWHLGIIILTMCNVNPVLINPKRLFNWEGAI